MKTYVKGLKGRLWDLDEDKEVLKPIWFDEANGLFECYQTTALGRIVRDREGSKLTWKMQGRIQWLPDVTSLPIRLTGLGKQCLSCSREAEWAVGDETPLSPILQGGVQFSRGQLTGRRYYCSRHYQGPRIVDGKGEIMTVWEDAGGVRPQWHS